MIKQPALNSAEAEDPARAVHHAEESRTLEYFNVAPGRYKEYDLAALTAFPNSAE